MNRKRHRILILSSWSWNEPLTKTYLLPSLQIIGKMEEVEAIYLQTHEKKSWQISTDDRVVIESYGNQFKMHHIPLPWRPFGLGYLLQATFHLLKLLFLLYTKRITHIHAFAPVAGMYGLILKRFSRRKLIIDSWEPHAEAMMQSGTWSKKSLSFKWLIQSERRQAKKADVLIAGSLSMHLYARNTLGVVRSDILHRPACIDIEKFYPSQAMREQRRIALGWSNATVCICVSKLGGLYLSAEFFQIMQFVSQQIGDSFRLILLSQNNQDEVASWAEQFGFPLEKLRHFHAAPEEVPNWLQAADFAINPQKPIAAKRYGTPVKDGEYWAAGLPVLIFPQIGDDSDIIANESAGAIIHQLEKSEVEKATQIILKILREPEHRLRIHQIAGKYRSFDLARDCYKKIYATE